MDAAGDLVPDSPTDADADAEGTPGNRGISPVVGVALLLGIVVALGAVSAYLAFGLADTSEPAPDVVFDPAADDEAEYVLVHESGDALDGDDLELRGTADPETATGTRLSAGDELRFYPISEEVVVVWHGESDASYVLERITVDRPLPEPDVGCEWVDSETNGGTEDAKVDGLVVNCDVETDKVIEVQDGGVVVGTVRSDSNGLDADDAVIYGDVDVEAVANLQDGEVAGDVTSRTADVKVGNGSVGGSIEAEKVAEIADDGLVEGTVESRDGEVTVLDSTVEGSVAASDGVKLQDATVGGDVDVDPTEFDCTNSTIGGEPCGSYTPESP